jgi:glycosyltransferase involved in cell wall biosynthesis
MYIDTDLFNLRGESLLLKNYKNLRERVIRIAIVDRLPSTTWYSWSLAKELARLLEEKGLLFFYGPKVQKCKEIKVRSNCIYKAVWSPYFYPFQIVSQAIKDHIKILHIQFEFVTFGPFHVSPLIIFLLLILKLLRIKTVVTLHGPIFPKNVRKGVISGLMPSFAKLPEFLLSLYIWFIYWLISRLASAIIVHANVFKKWLAEHGIHNCFVIPHGVHVDFLHNVPVAFNEGGSACEKIVLFFGVLSPRKGLETLLQAFSIVINALPNVRLVIAGDEPAYYRGYKRELEDMAKRLGISGKVSFLGRISDEEVEGLFHQADLVVLPYLFSVSASGPLSLAMAYGKPVIVSRTEFFEEVLGNQCTLLFFPPRDYKTLAQRITEVLSIKEYAEQISRKLKEKALELSWKKIALFTLELYKKLLNKEC